MVVSQLHINAKKSKVVAPPTGPQKLFYYCDSDLTVWYYTDLHTELLLRHYFYRFMFMYWMENIGVDVTLSRTECETLFMTFSTGTAPPTFSNLIFQQFWLCTHHSALISSPSVNSIDFVAWCVWLSLCLPPLLRLLLPILGSLTFPCHFLRIPFFLFNFFPLLCNSS